MDELVGGDAVKLGCWFGLVISGLAVKKLVCWCDRNWGEIFRSAVKGCCSCGLGFKGAGGGLMALT